MENKEVRMSALQMLSATLQSMESIAIYMEMFLRAFAPDDPAAMHAVMHISTAGAELTSAEYLLGDIQQ